MPKAYTLEATVPKNSQVTLNPPEAPNGRSSDSMPDLIFHLLLDNSLHLKPRPRQISHRPSFHFIFHFLNPKSMYNNGLLGHIWVFRAIMLHTFGVQVITFLILQYYDNIGSYIGTFAKSFAHPESLNPKPKPSPRSWQICRCSQIRMIQSGLGI